MTSEGAGKRKTLFNDIEITLLIIFSILVFLCYDVIAAIALHRDVNNTYYLATLLDHSIKFSHLWVLFYQSAFIMPLCVMGLVRYRLGASVVAFQCVVFAFIVMLLIAFGFFLIFPTNSIAILGTPVVANTGILNQLVVSVYKTLSPWNSMPSMHVAMSWFFFRVLAHFFRNVWGRLMYLIWFIGVVLATLTLRVHVIVDVLTGFILADLVFQGIFSKLSPKKFERLNRHFSIKVELIFSLTVVTVLAIGLYAFISLYGLRSIY